MIKGRETLKRMDFRSVGGIRLRSTVPVWAGGFLVYVYLEGKKYSIQTIDGRIELASGSAKKRCYLRAQIRKELIKLGTRIEPSIAASKTQQKSLLLGKENTVADVGGCVVSVGDEVEKVTIYEEE